MITYEDIERANATLQPLDVKGKPYIEVNQRIKAFRMVYPTGQIATEMLSNENGICVFKALVGFTTEDGEFIGLGTGTAYEKEGSTFINKTSYIENCETSAVGRALGMAGFGIDASVASYEEVQNAINNQKEDKPDKMHIAALIETAKIKGVTIERLCQKYNVQNIRELNWTDYCKCMAGFNKMPDKGEVNQNVFL